MSQSNLISLLKMAMFHEIFGDRVRQTEAMLGVPTSKTRGQPGDSISMSRDEKVHWKKAHQKTQFFSNPNFRSETRVHFKGGSEDWRCQN